MIQNMFSCNIGYQAPTDNKQGKLNRKELGQKVFRFDIVVDKFICQNLLQHVR